MADTKKVRASRFKDTDTIRFAKDDTGAAYGPNNNPRRDGSKSGNMFLKYQDGMTVAEAKAAGIRAVDIRWDLNAGHITVTPTSASQSEAA